MATDFGKICEMTFIQHAGISQRIRISQFQFTGVEIRHNFCYILCNFGEDRPLTPEITQRVSVPFGM